LNRAIDFREWEKTNHSAKEVKAAVDHHRRHKREIENELPTSIDICAFRVNVEGVRQGLLSKKDELINAILDNYSKHLRAQCAQVGQFSRVLCYCFFAKFLSSYSMLNSIAES
jgi:hypothetical protein